MRDPLEEDAQRLTDILTAIADIERHQPSAPEMLLHDELLLVWMAYHTQVIGEASSRLSLEFRKNHPEQPWADIIGMRNVIVHDYGKVDAGEIWTAIHRDLPLLKAFVINTLAELAPGEGRQ